MESKDLSELGYENLVGYKVFSNGELYIPAIDGKYVNEKHKRFKILKPSCTMVKGKQKYANWHISRHGGHYYINTHRVLALAFIPNPNNLPQVNHIDNNRHNYSLDNLEWVSSLENTRHAINFGVDFGRTKESLNRMSENMKGNTYSKGVVSKKRTLNDYEVSEIKRKYIPRLYSQRMLAKEYNVTQATILGILKGKIYVN